MDVFLATMGATNSDSAAETLFRRLAESDAVGSHTLAGSAASADMILFVDLHEQPDDPMLRRLWRHPLVRAYREKVRVYDQRDTPFYTFPGVYVGGDAQWRGVHAVGGPYPALINAPEPRIDAPDLLFSFRGARTHRVRHSVLALAHPRAEIEVNGADFLAIGQDEAQARRALERYRMLIQRSKFVLCPRGHGYSSFRLYETMAAGRVPVIISDRWLAPPGIDWPNCAVRVAERDVVRIPSVLEGLEDSWASLAAGSTTAVQRHFAPSRLWNHYIDSLAGLPSVGRRHTSGWWLRWPAVRSRARSWRMSLRTFAAEKGDTSRSAV